MNSGKVIFPKTGPDGIIDIDKKKNNNNMWHCTFNTHFENNVIILIL